MRRPVAVATLLLTPYLLALTALGALQPAYADTGSATIDHAQAVDGAVQMLVSVPDEAGTTDLAGVKVRIGDTAVGSTTVSADRVNDIKRVSILAIDTSDSMRGARIAEAKRAADTYLRSAPANVRIGVLTFDDDVSLLVKPTLDRTSARSAVDDLTLTRSTALYDGVLGALDAVGTKAANAGQRRVLVLSDGKDTTSTSLADVVSKISDSGVLVDAVALQQSDNEAEPLRRMADAGKGEVLDASEPAALSAAFAKEADALSRQVVVTADVPAGSAESSDVTITIPGSAQTTTAAAYLPVRAAVTAVVSASPTAVGSARFAISDRMMAGGVVAIAIGLIGLLVGLGMRKRAPDAEEWLGRQVSAYGINADLRRAEEQQSTQGIAGQAKKAAEKALSNNRTLEAKLEAKLEAAGSWFKPSEWLLLRAGVAVAAGLVGVLVGSGNIVLGLLFIVLGLIGPSIYLRFKKGARLRAFAGGLADTLQLMSGSLSAGLSLGQSIDTIVREGNEPIAGEFRRVVIETRLGVPLEDSLDGVAQRMESRDWEWVVMSIRIQREVGGNLAQLLLQVAETLRERDFLRRHVRALSAEGRLSAYILGALPPAFLVFLTVTKPDYVYPLYHTPLGYILLLGIALLLTVGCFWMSKVAKVDL